MDSSTSGFSLLPDEIVIKILSLLSPYGDYFQAKQVCRRWRRLVGIVKVHSNNAFYNAIKFGFINWRRIHNSTKDNLKDGLPVLRAGMNRRTSSSSQQNGSRVPSPRFSLCACFYNDSLYIFGGCTPENFALNDMYKFDLRTRAWSKIEANGLLPSPRECCTMVNYKDKMVIFGGWCQPRRLDLAPRFFNNVHIFDTSTLTWSTRVESEDDQTPLERAGHSASITKEKMIIIGGAQRNRRFDDVWVLDLNSYKWQNPDTRETKPSPRFGHSQFILNEDFVLIVGGCGGPDMLFNDAWLLNIYGWVWTEIKIQNRIFQPPLLWCHPAVKLNDQIVIFSEQRTCKKCLGRKNDIGVDETSDEELCSDCTSRPEVSTTSDVAPSYMQMYILDCSKCVLGHRASWRNIPTHSKAPLARSLYSAVVCKGEMVIFGGVQNTHEPAAIQTANNQLLFVSSADKRL